MQFIAKVVSNHAPGFLPGDKVSACALIFFGKNIRLIRKKIILSYGHFMKQAQHGLVIALQGVSKRLMDEK